MSLKSSNRFDKTRNDENISDSGSTRQDVKLLQEKVSQLENELKTFRAEIDMKMSIVQQILSTRNEMFTVQKKQIEREQALHENVLSHWKDIPDLIASGLCLKFTDDGENDIHLSIHDDQAAEKPLKSTGPGQGSSTKRKASSASARRDRQKKVKSRYREHGESDSESASDASPQEDPVPLDTFGDEGDTGTGDADADGEDSNEENTEDYTMERMVFVDYYSEEPAKPGQLATRTPVWKYYLREENGESALCKLCDEGGVQTVLKVKKGNGITVLHRHLKRKHADFAVDLVPLKKESEVAGSAAETSTVEAPMVVAGKYKNPIWNFFKESPDNPKWTTCFCTVEVSRGTIGRGATCINMVKHLQRRHPAQYEDYIAEKEKGTTCISGSKTVLPTNTKKQSNGETID